MTKQETPKKDAMAPLGAPEYVIPLPPTCPLRECENLVDAFSDVPKGGTFVLDVSGVEKMSSACVLAVVSLIRHCEAQSSKVVAVSPTPSFLDAFFDLGLCSEMMKLELR